MRYSEIKRVAGQLRKNPTKKEKELWIHLRKKQLGGYRFLRQHPLYYDHINNDHNIFIPDFYCSELHLIIELDGGVHENTRERDAKRDEILVSNGFNILRIRNEELNDIENLKIKILNFIEKNCILE